MKQGSDSKSGIPSAASAQTAKKRHRSAPSEADSPTPRKRLVLLVDDHPIVRQGLAELISRQEDLTVCAETGDGNSALELMKTLQPDLAIIDVSLGNANGLDLIKSMQRQDPLLPLLVLSMHDENLYAERALRAGARGYLMKQEASNRILDAIRRVLKGETVVSEAIKDRLLVQLVRSESAAPASPLERLSDRELQVFQLIGSGFATSHIARKLCLSVKTIETYREKLKQKLNLSSGAELLQQAIVWSKNNSAPGRESPRSNTP